MSESWHFDASVKDLYLFFGRHAEIAWVTEQLVQGQQLVAIYGAHRTGKTSLMHALIDRLPGEYLLIYLDADKAGGWGSESPLLQVAGEIGRKVRERTEARVPPPEAAPFSEDPLGAWQTYVDHIDAQLPTRQLVLVVDNAELFASEWLHVLLQTPVPLVVAAQSYEHLSERLSGVTLAAPATTLGPLDSDAADALVKALVTPTSPIDPWAVRRIVEVASDQPYYIHLVCRVLLESPNYKSPIMPPQVETAVQSLLSMPVAEFIVDWQSSLPREQTILAVFAALRGHSGVATEYDIQKACSRYGQYPPLREIVATLVDLARRGLLERMGTNTYRFRLELFRLWVDHHHSPEELFRKRAWRFKNPPLGPWAAKAREAFTQRRTLWLSVAVVVFVAILVGMQPVLRRNRRPATPTPRPTTAVAVQTPSTPTPTPTALPPLPSPAAQENVVLPGYDLLLMSRPDRQTAWQVYALDMLTGERLRLTQTEANERTPKWAPDGMRFVVVSDRDGDRELYVIDLEEALAKGAGYQPLQLTENYTPDWQPAWSPDGERIAFSSYRDGNWEIYVMNADGSDPVRVTEHPESDISPTWSPDGTKLLFVSRRRRDADLFVLDLESGDLEQVTTSERDEYDPAWSPDGEWIAFVTQVGEQADIYVMRVDGSEPTNISNSPDKNEIQPVWTADGERLVFVSYPVPDGKLDLYTMLRDGSQVVPLTNDSNDDIAPSLRHKG